MIVDPSDPTGIGLFSKCARNHASRSKPTNRPVSSRPLLEHNHPEAAKKKSKPRIGFDKQVSRQQRERMYKSGEVPPVGHYHPQLQKHPKLVWDILRAFHSNRKVPKAKQQPPAPNFSAQHKPSSQVEGEQIHQPQGIETEGSELLVQSKSKVLQGRSGVSELKSNKSCMVNMQKMTGRKERVRESTDWGDTDIMQSIRYVRSPITKKIEIGARKRQKVVRRGTVNSSEMYDYDYRVVRPKGGAVNFGVLKGRSQKTKTQHSYSYQHYQYDSYVWQNTSTVYPNTKTHGIAFEKQTHRYQRQTTGEQEQE